MSVRTAKGSYTEGGAMPEPDVLLSGYAARIPPKNRENGMPIADLTKGGEREEIVRRRFVYEYRPLYILAFVICFIATVWATAFTIDQLSDNDTARACFASGGQWEINEQGASECLRSTAR